MKRYEGIFKKRKKDDKVKNSRFDISKGRESVDEHFHWHLFILFFIENMNMKEKEVYKMNYINALNYMSAINQRNEVSINKNK